MCRTKPRFSYSRRAPLFVSSVSSTHCGRALGQRRAGAAPVSWRTSSASAVRIASRAITTKEEPAQQRARATCSGARGVAKRRRVSHRCPFFGSPDAPPAWRCSPGGSPSRGRARPACTRWCRRTPHPPSPARPLEPVSLRPRAAVREAHQKAQVRPVVDEIPVGEDGVGLRQVLLDQRDDRGHLHGRPVSEATPGGQKSGLTCSSLV